MIDAKVSPTTTCEQSYTDCIAADFRRRIIPSSIHSGSCLASGTAKRLSDATLMTMRSDLDLHGSKPGVFSSWPCYIEHYLRRQRHGNLVFIIIGPSHASNRDRTDRRFTQNSMENAEGGSVDRRCSMLVPSLTRSPLARRCCTCGVTVIVSPFATGSAPQGNLGIIQNPPIMLAPAR